MTTKRKNIIIACVVSLILIFIYIPLRSGFLEQQFVRSVSSSADKIVISISSFEKDKDLPDKDLSKFYTLIKDKHPIALVAIADKKNKILKAGKNDIYIKSNKSFDSIIDSFIRDEFKLNKKNDFIIRYYDQDRFYIFVKQLTGGKMLLVYPFKLGIINIIQFILEITLIVLISIIIMTIIFIYKNKRYKETNKIDIIPVKADFLIEPDINATKEKDQKSVWQNIFNKEDRIKIVETEKEKVNLDLLSGVVFELFTYISSTYYSDSISLFVVDENASKLDKIFELKGKAFIKIDDPEFNSISMNHEIIDELKNSSIILLEKGRKVNIPILYRNALLGIIIITKEKEFKGPEINNIKEQLKKIIKPLSEYILLNDMILNKTV